MSEEFNAQNTANEDTILQEPETQQDKDLAVEPETASQDGENNNDVSAPDVEDSANSFLEIKYNHEKRMLSQDEARILAQKGLYYESAYNSIERIATLNGVSVEDFLNDFEKKQDDAYRESLMERFGGDEEAVNGMMELREIKKKQTLENAVNKKQQESEAKIQSENERLANEFSAMKKEFPELTDFTALPENVKKAAFDGMALSHAYLLHLHNENKKIAAAQKSAQEAAKKTAGSMADDKPTNTNENALLKGIWG